MTTNINIKTDSALKLQAEKLFSELGLNMSTALNIFLRQAVRENRIPFEITKNTPNAETVKAMQDTLNDYNMTGPFNSMQALKDSLNA